MNGMVLYFGMQGRSTAAHLARATGFELINLALAPQLDFASANPIVLGSELVDGKLAIAPWLAAHWDQLRAKKVVLYTLGDDEALEAILQRDLSPEMRLRIRLFKLPVQQRAPGPLRQMAQMLHRLNRRLGCVQVPVPDPVQSRPLAPPHVQPHLQALHAHIVSMTRFQSQASRLRGPLVLPGWPGHSSG